MDLKCDEPFLGCIGCVFIGHVDGLHAIDEVLHMITLGHDPVIVPLLIFDRRLDSGAVTDTAGDFDRWLFAVCTGFDYCLLAAFGKDATTSLLIKNSAVGLATSKSA